MMSSICVDKKTYDIMNGIEEMIKDTSVLRALSGDNIHGSVLEKQIGDDSTITPEIRAKFESVFGIDQNSRTPAQWRNLVKTYGIEAVIQQESMAMEEVTNRCTESFSASLRRALKKTRH